MRIMCVIILNGARLGSMNGKGEVGGVEAQNTSCPKVNAEYTFPPPISCLRRRDVVSFQCFRFWKQVIFDIVPLAAHVAKEDTGPKRIG